MYRRYGILLLALAWTGRAIGQTVDVELRAADTQAPVAGAIVRLLGASGVAAQGLSNEQGKLRLVARMEGTYRLKIDRIGSSSTITDPFPLATGEIVRRQILLERHPLLLPEVSVRGKSSCGFQNADPVAAALWEEVRKTLTASVITLQQMRPAIHIREYLRELRGDGTPIRRWTTRSVITRGPPFAAMPAPLLVAEGFVRKDGDSVNYAAPDAALLLSDEFVSTHCFRAEPERDGLVGLAFTPVPGRRVSDVQGTLRIDRAAGELRFLVYGYSGLGQGIAVGGDQLGGRVEFLRLPTGAWIISAWHIRMPVLIRRPFKEKGQTAGDAIVSAFLERGGTAQAVATEAGVVDRAIVVGRVWDSVAGKGLAGAMVAIEGGVDTVSTDAEGRYELDLALSGDHTLTISHPKLGLLRDPTNLSVLLSVGDTLRVNFAVPSMAAFARAFCGGTKGRAGVIGVVVSGDGTPIKNLAVRAPWLTSGGSRLEQDRTGNRGLYALCNLSPGPTIPIQVFDDRRGLLEVSVQLEPREYRWLELRLPPP